MNIIYTKHLKIRLNLRKIPTNYPKIILENPDEEFYDIFEKREISIKRLKYNKKLRKMMIVYEIKDNNREIITIHPIREDQIINRIKSGRWQKK